MGIQNNLESFKSKKELADELNYYKSFILKKIKDGDYNSALEKVRSALVILEEHQNLFNIKRQLLEFYELYKQVLSELSDQRMIYERRFNNLLKEKLSESNLESFSKLLAMLKNDVDSNQDKYNLYDISANINNYFKYIKKMYEILSCYKVLNYHDASEKIFEFVREIKSENLPNLKMLILLTYQNLICEKLNKFSVEFDKITLPILSEKMAINQRQLIDFINLIKKQPKSPIQDYISTTKEIIFRKSSF
ncbi:MAG: type II toxin-antitoxin system ParD family antitoxin [Promethearchaeota archaeon]|nr:MAG: type II toxin-antitoxin system ParD family antitoxin [Candidatus Lokiarchaeota archaeon]